MDHSKLERTRSTSILEEAYDVTTFVDGSVMLETLGDAPPTVMLLDWEMPGLTGIDLCRFLRERYDEVTLPILLLTGRAERADFQEGLAAGANDYVTKPYDETSLVARVRTLVRIQRQAEETRDRELWLRTTLTSVGEGVIATDGEGRVLFMNPVAEALTGVAQADALNEAFNDVCPIVTDGTARAAVIVRRDGQRVAIEHTASPIAGPGKPVRGVVHVLRDARAARARADFEEKLVGIVSHDLRNPLQAILLGTSALLARKQVDDTTKKSIVRIQRSADRATKLISDVLDFTQARLGSGIHIRPRLVTLHDLAAQVVDDVMAAHPEREVVLEASGNTDGTWDPDRVAQVLANLLSNALEYGAKDRPVTVRTRADGASVVVAVHNDGPPIAVDLVPHMFEPMKRGVDLADNSSRSVGLGLYIVKHIIDAHGGTIDVRSTAQDGTTFSIALPRSRTLGA